MQTITKEYKAYNELQNLGFHLVKNDVAYIDFYGQWLAFENWCEALDFINSI